MIRELRAEAALSLPSSVMYQNEHEYADRSAASGKGHIGQRRQQAKRAEAHRGADWDLEMHVKLMNPIPSIQQMDDFDLPDFAVLIGRNGVGKTQLLNAIAGGSAVIAGVPPSDIEKYDINSFQPQDSGKGGWGNASFFHMTIGQYFSQMSGPALVEVAERIFKNTLDQLGLNDDASGQQEFETAVRAEYQRVPDFGALVDLRGDGPVFAYINSIHNNVFSKLHDENQQSSKRGTFGNNQAALICQAMKLSGKLPHKLCREDILRASHYEGDTIGNQLSQIFARYKAEQYAWRISKAKPVTRVFNG